jgi:hypothetical protein
MSTDTAPNNNANNNNPADMYTRNRRGSISQAALTNLFQRGNSVPNGSGFPAQATGPIDVNRRRLSVTTLGLSGTSPSSAQPFNIRRGSMSTNSTIAGARIGEPSERTSDTNGTGVRALLDQRHP